MIKTLMMVGLTLTLGLASPASAEWNNPCNPCGMKNPCNPCSMKKHHKMNPCNPCGMKKDHQMNPCNPCSMKKHNPCSMNPCNPCGMNPCSSGNKDIRGNKFKNFQEAVEMGRKMWHDENLGTSGLACLSCHGDFEMLNLDKRQNFPHFVKMTGDVVTLDQMINYCMLNPMKGKPFKWNSREMTAMAAYYRAYRMKYLRSHKR